MQNVVLGHGGTPEVQTSQAIRKFQFSQTKPTKTSQSCPGHNGALGLYVLVRFALPGHHHVQAMKKHERGSDKLLLLKDNLLAAKSPGEPRFTSRGRTWYISLTIFVV